MTRWRGRLPGLITVLAVIAAYLAVVEIGLQFLPVATGLHSLPVSAAQPIFHFEPNRDFVYSHGWKFDRVNRGRVNNAGWVNDQDYRADDKLPLIAVIGDSFIEAQMVPHEETLQGRLAKALAGRFRVYSFAAAGAPLAEFPVYAGYAMREFGASAVVIAITNYDFARSELAYNSPTGFWIYQREDDRLQLRLIPYQPGWLRSLARRSALARYLVLNLRLGERLTQARQAVALSGSSPALAAPSDDSGARVATSEAVIAAFFRDLPALAPLPAERVLFVLDGYHYPEVATAASGSYGDRLRRRFRAAAEARSYEAVDLDPLFFARYGEDRTRFDFPGDTHWNGDGHAIAAAGVLSSRLLGYLPKP